MLLFVKSGNKPLKIQQISTPWAIKTYRDGSLQVLNIHLGSTTLQEVIDSHSAPDNIALFTHDNKPQTIEAYFSYAPTGPLRAKLVLTLSASRSDMIKMMERATSLSVTTDGHRKLFLSNDDQQSLLTHSVESLTLIPDYSGLDATYFRQRLGEPVATHKESESAVSWYYPQKGLTVLIDDDGKEVFQYQNPSDFNRTKEPDPSILSNIETGVPNE